MFKLESADVIFVWSKITYALYSFSTQYGVLFFYMEEKRDPISIQGYLEALQLPKNTATLDMVETIASLLDKKEKKEKATTVYVEREIPKITKECMTPVLYSLYGVVFSFELPSSIQQEVLIVFQHLKVLEKKSRCKYIFKVTQEGDFFSIYINGKQVHKNIQSSVVLGYLQDLVRITIYENNNFFIALHAAMFSYNNIPIIFPAVSGSGKSTLSAFLMQKENFNFYSDEVTLVDTEYNIHPLPLVLTLKEGSWKILTGLEKEIKEAKVYRRFDYQKVKYITPKNIATHTIYAQEAFMIFPKYQEGVVCKLQPLSLVESLNFLVNSGYHLHQRENFESLKKYLEYLATLKIYTLTYSRLDEAYITVKQLIDNN